jgi:hypothetical protein
MPPPHCNTPAALSSKSPDAWIIVVCAPTPTSRPNHLQLNYIGCRHTRNHDLRSACPLKTAGRGRTNFVTGESLSLIFGQKYLVQIRSRHQGYASPFKGILSKFSRCLQQVGDEPRGIRIEFRYHCTVPESQVAAVSV